MQTRRSPKALQILPSRDPGGTRLGKGESRRSAPATELRRPVTRSTTSLPGSTNGSGALASLSYPIPDKVSTDSAHKRGVKLPSFTSVNITSLGFIFTYGGSE